ncbi:MAG: septal ring lytic transglycosylase RlpA family protein [bacterium]
MAVWLSAVLTGCAGYSLVRVPHPLPTSGIGEPGRTLEIPPPPATVSPPAAPENPPLSTASGKSQLEQVGVATYYGSDFHGRRTASGERFNMYAMTAAHRSLPFNTKVKITNLDNDKVAYVRINDRGPFQKNRIIDLSRAAAKELGFEQKGIARVRIEIL